MVKGLTLFQERFSSFSDKYILIGGTACDLLMEEAGLAFRSTRDLDIVLCVEVLDADFLDQFWGFIKEGDYQIRKRYDGSKSFYRFEKPTNSDYPVMLELFSRQPDIFAGREMVGIVPISVDDEMISLSAILIDDEHYDFIISQRILLGDLPLVTAKCLIPLKARAFMDLKERRESGESVDFSNISKHKNDVFRLFQLLEPGAATGEIPEIIRAEMSAFIETMKDDVINLPQLGIHGMRQDDILKRLKEIYCG